MKKRNHPARRLARRRIGGYQEYAPADHLAQVLDSSWLHLPPPNQSASSAAVKAELAHRVIPHFGASLALERRVSATGDVEQARLIFLGPVSQARLYPTANEELIALRLHPEHCGALLGVDLGEHWDAIECYSDLCPLRSNELLASLDVEASPDGILFRLHTWLERRLATMPRRMDSGLETSRVVIDQLRQRHGAVPVDALAREHGRSPQYLRRVFRRSLGTSPKRIACLMRLNAAVDVADAQRAPDWADLAFRLGYSDQAHLVRETKRWTGVSPTVLHAERRAEIAAYRSGPTEMEFSRA